jgi:hypothetical protein
MGNWNNQQTEMIMNHFEIVSMNKSYLGRVNYFFPKVHLDEKETVYKKQFKIPDTHRPLQEESIANWQKLGVIQKLDSLYNSQVFCIPKKVEMDTALYKTSENSIKKTDAQIHYEKNV